MSYILSAVLKIIISVVLIAGFIFYHVVYFLWFFKIDTGNEGNEFIQIIKDLWI